MTATDSAADARVLPTLYICADSLCTLPHGCPRIAMQLTAENQRGASAYSFPCRVPYIFSWLRGILMYLVEFQRTLLFSVGSVSPTCCLFGSWPPLVLILQLFWSLYCQKMTHSSIFYLNICLMQANPGHYSKLLVRGWTLIW